MMMHLVLLSLTLTAPVFAANPAPGAVASVTPAPPAPAPAATAGADEAGLLPGIPPGPRPAEADIQPLAYSIGLTLRCPVCQGLSVADSSAETAVNMQKRIRELVALGYDEGQICDYFVDRYGEWILLDPQPEGLNLLIWIGPGLMVGLGLAWAAATVMAWRREPDAVPLPSDAGLVAKDRYEQRLLAELEED